MLFTNSSAYERNVARAMDTGKKSAMALIILQLIVIVVATTVHLFSFGDNPDAKEEVFVSSL